MRGFGERLEDREGEEETTFDHPDDDREAETNGLEWDDTTFDYHDAMENLDEMREADRDLGRAIGVEKGKKTNIKKSILFELGYKLNKGDGKKSTELFNRLGLTESEKSENVIGMKFDNVKIIILKSKKFKFSENVKFRSKINEFENLAREAREEHERTAVSDIEEEIPGVYVDDKHAGSVLRDSSERLNEEISDRSDRIIPLLTVNEIREFRGILNLDLPTPEEEEQGITVGTKINLAKEEGKYWENKANDVEGDPQKQALYESIAEVAKLKADELRLFKTGKRNRTKYFGEETKNKNGQKEI